MILMRTGSPSWTSYRLDVEADGDTPVAPTRGRRRCQIDFSDNQVRFDLYRSIANGYVANGSA